MTEFEPELCDSLPEEFTKLDDATYIQCTDIHYVEYHSLDGTDSFKGYECLSRVITKDEFNKITGGISK